MAYNFLCESAKEPDWKKLNRCLRKYRELESFPFLLSDGGRFGLAVSIPMKHVGPRAYKQVVRVHKVLTKTFGFRVYDLYYGKEVDKDHLKQLRQEIT